MTNVLFVCTGNTCRSPMAEALLREKGRDDIEVQSAGTSASPGMSASKETVEVLKERDILLRHAAKPLTKERVDWADLILTMTKNHHGMTVQQFPEAADKVFTVKEFAWNEESGAGDITDPIGGSRDTYRHTADELETLVEKILERMNED
ncbi:low molecular weight protein arginine phosphatase [Salibacterium halotolerans]|uniref:Protein-tyrosine phosphatase n=1 Tax=Salibacterium halotolerans TaxID=1884432 RepID=A0A1I5V2R5_9BACI|nr:low molecular weight protein arginine phosphatase [Salibacterium halotolerans]SFQ01788.1 protein-tyrosine phosphatase [Salibacterium halotolerans]